MHRNKSSLWDRLRRWAWTIKRDVLALYLAGRDPRVSWYAKLTAACVAAYALSPIDLIPDFIPVIGYLDDVVLVPLGILLAVKLISTDVMTELRAKAEVLAANRPKNRVALIVIVLIWLAAAASFAWWAAGVWRA